MNRFMRSIRNLLRVTWLELLWGIRVPESLFYNVVAPAVVLLLLGAIRSSADQLDVMVPGLVALSTASSAMQGVGTTMGYMRTYGAWRTLRASPIPVPLYFAGLVLSRVVRATLIAFVLLALAVVALGYRPGGALLAAPVLVTLGALVFASLGLLISCLARSPQAVPGLINTVLLPMVFTGNVLFVSDLEWVRRAGSVLPLTHFADLLRGALTGTGGHWAWSLLMLSLWLVGSAWTASVLSRVRPEEA